MAIGSAQTRALATMHSWLADGSIRGDASLPPELVLAERLGVSRSTVRKVLATLAQEGLVGARTRGRRVRDDGGAGTSEQAVVLIGSGSDERGLDESQEGSVEDACLRRLREAGRTVLLVDHEQAQPARALAALGRRPAGIICTQFAAWKAAWREQLVSWRNSGIATVVHGSPGDHPGIDCVRTDHEGGAYELTRRLLALGRRRIRQVWHSPALPAWLAEREAGHARAMAEAGLAVAPPLRLPEEPPRSRQPDPANLEQRAQAYLGFLYQPLQAPEPPDALIAVNDANAVGVIGACRMLGRQVHAEVAVAGFDCTWATAWEWPLLGLAPFVTAHKRNHAIGRALADLLLERLGARAAAGALTRSMPIEIVQPAEATARG